jgi:hypothetical protein
VLQTSLQTKSTQIMQFVFVATGTLLTVAVIPVPPAVAFSNHC